MASIQHYSGKALAIAATLTAAGFAPSAPALAHPHVWVAVETTVVYENGAVSGLRQRWTFDELYSSMAVEGLDVNKDGKYDRNELAELAGVNIEGLKDFEYFTFAKLGTQALAFAAPRDVFMEYVEGVSPGPAGTSDPAAAAAPPAKDGFWSNLAKSVGGKQAAETAKPKVLSLVFTLPMQQPVLADAKGFNFATYDPTFYIWFDLAKDNPIRLADGAPKGCAAAIAAPASQPVGQTLGDAANQQAGATIGFGGGKTVTVSCPSQ